MDFWIDVERVWHARSTNTQPERCLICGRASPSYGLWTPGVTAEATVCTPRVGDLMLIEHSVYHEQGMCDYWREVGMKQDAPSAP